ncbi:hypothetical protein CFC21_112729 [Triticum aestivum]|uniref:F-box domain-containing protein n=2 Tax=Triticum aestivum TaxID=4565 RepID=A0A9R1FPH5_WHEAT|nr:hypothetical protein CFC21_043866 [Triticum aestivum]MBC2899915.1 hypothetical protein [Triticum aestivum]CDM82866.1 unnamed protein product [Triticum aestivum]
MGDSQIAADAGSDRLSNLRDGVLGHILSFLETREAARAATLSSRWRHVMASVHTVSMSMEPLGRPVLGYGYDGRYDRNKARFIADVTAALFSRNSRPSPAAASAPLRALRVSMERYCPEDGSKVDQWVSYALWHAAPEFGLDLRLGRGPICSGPCSLHPSHDDVAADGLVGNQAVAGNPPKSDPDDNRSLRAHPKDDVPSSDDEETAARSWNPPSGEFTYTVPRGLFSCAALRSLRLGYCRLSPPAAISLPALEALHLTHILEDEEEHVQRLISGCPRLADLTLEACGTVTAVSLLDNTHLRRLALRCCHNLSSLAVDTPDLHSFEYRGAVPDTSILTVGGLPSVTSCKVDICTIYPLEEAGELVKLGSFLHQLASTAKHLQLCSARMGSWFADLPVLPALRHLELAGSVPRNDDPAVVIAATSSILRRTPNLELLTLFFEEEAPRETEWQWHSGLDHHAYVGRRSEGELLDAHRLHYCEYDSLDCALAPAMVPPCLGSRVRKIELVHYQGGRAQRTLARFLLRNAAVLENLYCGFPAGPHWVQTELMREMEGWVVSELTSTEFR